MGPYDQEAELVVEAYQDVTMAVAFTWPDTRVPTIAIREAFARDLAYIWTLDETPFHHPLS